jgi:hypothetical protein
VPVLSMGGGGGRGPEEVAAQGIDGGLGEDDIGGRARMVAGCAGQWPSEDGGRAAQWPGDDGGRRPGQRWWWCAAGGDG